MFGDRDSATKAHIKRTLQLSKFRSRQVELTTWKCLALAVAALTIAWFANVKKDLHTSFLVVDSSLGLLGIFGLYAVMSKNIRLVEVFALLLSIVYMSRALVPFLVLRVWGKEPLLDFWCSNWKEDEVAKCRENVQDQIANRIGINALSMLLLGAMKLYFVWRYKSALEKLKAEESRLVVAEYDVENPRFSLHLESDFEFGIKNSRSETLSLDSWERSPISKKSGKSFGKNAANLSDGLKDSPAVTPSKKLRVP